MTPLSTTHLSEEALDDVLIDLGSAESHAHLAVCGECRAKIAIFRGDVALFNAASMSWSNSRRLQPLPTEGRGAHVRDDFHWLGGSSGRAGVNGNRDLALSSGDASHAGKHRAVAAGGL